MRRLPAEEVTKRYQSIPKFVWPKLLAELVEVVSAQYRRRGMKDAEQAHAKAVRIVLEFSAAIGGKVIYLPTGDVCDVRLHSALEAYLSGVASKDGATTALAYDANNTRNAVHIARIVQSLWPLIRTDSEDESAARAELHAVVQALSGYMGGRVAYIPRGDRLGIYLAHSDIADRLGSTSAMQLADEYETNHIRIYSIAKEQRERRKKKQPVVWNKDRQGIAK